MIKILKDVTEIGIHNSNSVTIRYDSYIYINEPFKDFNPNLLEVFVSKFHDFKAYLMYSFDNMNWSKDFKFNVDKPFDDDIIEYINKVMGLRDFEYFPDLYIAIRFEKDENFYKVDDIKFNEFTPDSDRPQVIFEHIKYDNELINIKEDIRIKQEFETNNRFPKWSIYDNHQGVLKRWLDDIDGVTQIVGQPVIYFKTAVKTLSNTLQTSDEKEIISIKRFKVTFPSNELPKDTMIYTEYDYTMADESYSEISWRIFRQLFGEKAIPDIGDLMFIPLLNKMYKVVHVEPQEDKKFMGKIGWFNVYITKYTEDDTLIIEDEMYKAIHAFDEDLTNEYGETFENDMLKTATEFLNETVYRRDEIITDTNEEKKHTTENYTNKFTDTNTFVDVKETDSVRKSLNKRLEIVSVNPDQNSFPVNMYDCSKIDRKKLGFEYDLNYLQKLSNLNLYPSKSIMLGFNMVLLGRNTSQIFDIVSDNLMLFSIAVNKGKIQIYNQFDMSEVIEFEHTLIINEYYQINIEIKQRTYVINIYLLRDKTKKLVYKDLYIDNRDLFIPTKVLVNGLMLFGGNFYIGEPYLNIDDINIVTDYVNPLIKMNSFGN